MDMPILQHDFDPVALVVDWLDACRGRDIDALLDLYAPQATLECGCGEGKTCESRADIAAYWRPRLVAFSPDAFGLEEIAPSADGVVLDYLSFDGKPVRVSFTFDDAGKIRQSRCVPVAQPA
jgi:hypothetical protein